MPAVADLIVSRLRDAGVTHLFGVPGGGSNLNLIEAAGRAGLPFVLTSTETSGALAAMAQAEITGRIGACLTTLGPGAASVVNGVACAFLDRAPLVVLTDSHPLAAREMTHQRLDHAALLGPVTKWSATLTPDNASATIDRAIAIANAAPPGPVHLDCPGDVAAAMAPAPTLAMGVGAERDRPSPTPRFDAMLSRSRKPLLLVGLGARKTGDAAAIRALCDGRGVPAMVTYKAKGVVPDPHPFFAGVLTNALIEEPLLAESDLLIGVGLDPVELIPRPWTHPQPIVYCGSWRMDDRHVPFAAQFIADVPTAIDRIAAVLPPSAWYPDRVRAAVVEQRRRISIPGDGGFTAQRVVEVAARQLAPNCRVTVDAGAHMFPVTMLWPVADPNGMLISNGLSTMGFALPAAIGAGLLDRSQPVIALTGDGGLLMCVAELLTAVRERLRAIVIVFSDASLSLIEIKQQQRRYQPAGVALGEVAWPALARSFGATAWSASTESELERCLERALHCSGVVLIEARIDRSNYGPTLRAVRG